MAEFTQAQTDEIKSLAADSFAHWLATGTEDQKAAGIRIGEEIKADPSKLQEHMGSMNELFAEADTNQDGFLEEAEYMAWFGKLGEEQKAKGLFVDERQELKDGYFRICKAAMPDAVGIDMAIIMKAVGVAMAESLRLKEEAGM